MYHNFLVLDDEPSGDSQEDKEKSIQELKKEIKMLYDEISRLQEENRKLKEEFKSVKFDEHFLEHGNTTKKTNFFTSFPDYATFLWALNFVYQYCHVQLCCPKVAYFF